MKVLNQFGIFTRQPILELPISNTAARGKERAFDLFSPLSLGVFLTSVCLIFAFVAPLFMDHNPNSISGVRLSPPGVEYWFGTDALGRDFFSRVVEAVRISIWLSLLSTLATAIPGILAGLWSGYFQGWVDNLLSRLTEVVLAIPSLMIIILLVARFEPSIHTLVISLMITGFPTFFRVTRNETLSMKQQQFVEAGRSIGLTDAALIFRYILVNIHPALITLLSIRMGNTLLIISGLGFIGLGMQPPQAELGALLASGREYFYIAWWLYVIPSIFIVLLVLGFNLLGEGIRDHLRH